MSTLPNPQSRVEAILENILGENWPTPTPLSRAEALLLLVANEIKNSSQKTKVAKTAADMTDPAFFYVYVGDETGYVYGDWYYYDEDDSEWKDGGVWQSTGIEVDTTLTESGVAADSASAGAAISTAQTTLKQYIELLTKPAQSTMTASENIPAWTFFMVGNTLYRSTQAIASGSTITVGVNCREMSLTEALNYLQTV